MTASNSGAGLAGPLIAMMLAQCIVMIGVVAVPVLAPLISVEFGLPTNFAGVFQSAAFCGAATMTVVGGTLVRRHGGIRQSQVCCLLTASAMLITLTGTSTGLALSALLAGAGYGIATPAASHVLARITTAATRGIVFSVKQSAVTLGGLLAGLTLPAAAEVVGWEGALSLVAIFAVGTLVAIQPLRNRLDDDRSADVRVNFRSVAANVALVWHHPVLRAISCAAFSYATVQVTLFALYVTLLIQLAEITLIEAGWLYAVMQGTGVVARIGWGWVSDKWIDARVLMAALGVGSVIASVWLTQVTPDWNWLALLSISGALGATIVAWNGVYLAEIARQMPHEQVSAATAGTVMFSFSGIVFGPAAFAFLASLSDSYLLPMGLLDAMVLASAVYLWRSASR